MQQLKRQTTMARSRHFRSGQVAKWARPGKLQHQQAGGLVGQVGQRRTWRTFEVNRGIKNVRWKSSRLPLTTRAQVFPGFSEQVGIYQERTFIQEMDISWSAIPHTTNERKSPRTLNEMIRTCMKCLIYMSGLVFIPLQRVVIPGSAVCMEKKNARIGWFKLRWV